MSVAIKIEKVSKLYRLGTVGTGTLAHDLNRWWHAIRGKEDPYAKVGQVNDRTKGAKSTEQSAKGEEPTTTLSSSPSALRSGAPGPDYVWALRDINLEVQQGEILGIIGRNGAGKSTLLKLLSRVTAPTTGSIKTKGRIASLLEVGTGFHPEMTGRENIYMNGAILGMRRYEITRQLDEIVEFSGCAKYLDTPVKRYSSGMTVRLGFAVAAHLQCEILIVDEVLAVGDIEFQKKCLGKMRDVANGGKTVLFVSHQLPSIRELTCQTVWISKGSVEDRGHTADVIGRYLSHGRDSLSAKPSVLDLERSTPDLTRELSFKTIEFVNQPKTNIDEAIKIRFDVERRNPAACKMAVGITIYNNELQPVASSFSEDITIEPKSNTLAWDLTISTTGLAPGSYFCAMSIGLPPIASSGRIYDSLYEILPFSIPSTKFKDMGLPRWNPGWGSILLPRLSVSSADDL